MQDGQVGLIPILIRGGNLILFENFQAEIATRNLPVLNKYAKLAVDVLWGINPSDNMNVLLRIECVFQACSLRPRNITI